MTCVIYGWISIPISLITAKILEKKLRIFFPNKNIAKNYAVFLIEEITIQNITEDLERKLDELNISYIIKKNKIHKSILIEQHKLYAESEKSNDYFKKLQDMRMKFKFENNL